MSKNNSKEKSSFWKKLGLGKNKTPSSLSLRSEQENNHDRISIKSKRLSGGTFLSHQPQPQQNNQHNEPEPPLPTKTIKKQPRVNLPKVNIDDSEDILSSFSQQQQQHVYNNQLTNDNTTTTSTFNNKVDVPSNAIVTPTAASLHQESFHEGREVENKEQVPAPTPTIADVTPAIIMDNDNKSNSSFVVVRSSTDNHSPTSSSPVNDDLETTNNEELLSIIANLKSQLENEKATVNVLQKQKEAVAKDLDYFELTVDELSNQNTELVQQLEEEKIKNLRYLEDLNLSLEKQRSNADNARDKSFAVDQTKLEFEAYQEQCCQEQKELMDEIAKRDKSIRELKYRLSKSEDQVDTLQTTIDQLVKSHTDEISRITAQAAQAQQAAVEKEKSNWPLHTPNGSPRMQSKEALVEEEQDNKDWFKAESSPIPSSSSPFFNSSSYGAPQSMTRMDSSSAIANNDLDDQLMKLLAEKEQLQSSYSKIPITGGGPQSRRRREEIEEKLDQVDSQLSKVRQKIRRS